MFVANKKRIDRCSLNKAAQVKVLGTLTEESNSSVRIVFQIFWVEIMLPLNGNDVIKGKHFLNHILIKKKSKYFITEMTFIIINVSVLRSFFV